MQMHSIVDKLKQLAESDPHYKEAAESATKYAPVIPEGVEGEKCTECGMFESHCECPHEEAKEKATKAKDKIAEAELNSLTRYAGISKLHSQTMSTHVDSLVEGIKSTKTVLKEYSEPAKRVGNDVSGDVSPETYANQPKLDEKYMGFKKLEKAVAKGGADNPGAVAASIGREKYGKKKFQKAAAQHKKLGEITLEDELDEDSWQPVPAEESADQELAEMLKHAGVAEGKEFSSKKEFDKHAKKGDTYKTAKGTVEKTATGIKHTAKSEEDDEEDTDTPKKKGAPKKKESEKTSAGLPKFGKEKAFKGTSFEKKAPKGRKDGKTWGMKDHKKFESVIRESIEFAESMVDEGMEEMPSYPGWKKTCRETYNDCMFEGNADYCECKYGDQVVATYGEPSMVAEEPVMEKAPPGMEDMVMKLKKEYPGHPERAFATAWSIYNKKHGKKEESVEESCCPSCGSADCQCEDVEEGINRGLATAGLVGALAAGAGLHHMDNELLKNSSSIQSLDRAIVQAHKAGDQAAEKRYKQLRDEVADFVKEKGRDPQDKHGKPVVNWDKNRLEEDDMEEGNKFSGELAKAKAEHKKEFEVDGKEYQVKESDKDMENKDDSLDRLMGLSGIKKDAKPEVEVKEDETNFGEGNEFSGALEKAREQGKATFSVGGKEYHVTNEGEDDLYRIAELAGMKPKKVGEEMLAKKDDEDEKAHGGDEPEEKCDVCGSESCECDKDESKEESKEDSKEEKVEESSDDAKESSGGMFGKGVYEGYNTKVEDIINETLSINTSQSSEGNDSVTVTATEEDAHSLVDLLRNAGLGGGSAYKEYSTDVGPEDSEAGLQVIKITEPEGTDDMADKEEEELDEWANSPFDKREERGEVADTAELVDKISGGLNGPKKQYDKGYWGDNPAGSGLKGYVAQQTTLREAEQAKTLESLYKQYEGK